MHSDVSAAKAYTYCPGPKSVFMLIENGENMKAVSQEVSEEIAIQLEEL